MRICNAKFTSSFQRTEYAIQLAISYIVSVINLYIYIAVRLDRRGYAEGRKREKARAGRGGGRSEH